ncbi:TonB-dependent receptor [Sphingomonas sabuli]|uniref:TonB-dependent receptor n=1 Tax=Sphingomonas sabuli TaxID=2764186 RepID=A0A7G9KZU2_9SPHN|nr:TonB-dependent receptor [Sphingomonas sabuli]QNM81891.1 TonB-dependent receptor [Sphingomonas sabuli]
MMAQPAFAQDSSANLQGHVDGAAAGTTVVATDTNTGQTVTGTVDAEGNYAIYGLRPSTYSVAVDGKPAQQTTLLIGQTSIVDFETAATTTATGEAGAIVVTGRRVRQQSTPQAVSTNITPSQIENLPQNQRNFLSFAQLAPGVELISPSGAQQLQAGALAPQNANILLDGMSFKNPINHGGMLGQNFGDFGNPFPQIAIQEYQLQTQNFGAENGQSASALLSAITKTGGNKFHGSVFVDWQPEWMVERPYFDKKNNVPKRDSSRTQFGGDFGGPIIPEKLSFYVAVEGTNQKRPPATFNDVATVIPQNIRDQINSAVSLEFKQRLYFGKLTWFATPDDTVNLSAYRRRQSNLADFGGTAVQEHGHLLRTNQDRYQLQWRHSAGDFTNFVNISYDKATQGAPNVSDGPEYVLSNGTDTGSRIVELGANGFEQDDTIKSLTLREDATWRRGAHTLKAGGQAVFYNLNRIEAANFNGTYFVSNPCDQTVSSCGPFDITTATPFAGRINVNPAPGLKAKSTQLGIYITDEWKPDDHWTVNAGIRWDFESNPNNKNYVTPAAIADALRNYPGWAARGIDPEDYISNGSNRKPFYGAFQPRIGAAYDVRGDGDLIFFGGIGRYYDRNLFIQGVIEQQQNANVVLTVPLTECASGAPPAYCSDPEALRAYAAGQGFTGGAVWVLPNKVRLPYSDQFDLGVRKRFGEINTTLTYSHIESHNISMFARSNFYSNGWYTVVLTPDGCMNGGDQWIIDFTPNGPFPNCPATTGQLPGFNGKLNRGLNNGRARLDALFLQIEKPFTEQSTWGFTQALTLQRARSNVAQELNSDEFYNGPNLDTYGWNYVNGIAKWRSVTSVNWRAPFGFTVSGILNLSSGPAFGNIVAPWTGLTGPVPQGACCYANMGGVYFPKKDIAYKRLDMRVAKTFKTPWGHEATIDFQAFNVFNWLNRTYSSWGAGGGNPPPLTENGQVGNDQRQFQAGFTYKF